MGSIFAIGGGEIGYLGTPIQTTLIDQEIIAATNKHNPNLLFVPTASNDAESYCKQIEIHFGERLSCKVDHLRLLSGITEREINAKIEWADIVYVGGGNTLKMLEVWRELVVDTKLIAANKDGTILAGLSAGAICWFKYGGSDSLKMDDPSKPYIAIDGLDMIDGLAVPHFDTEGRQASLQDMLQELDCVGFGIDECAAMEIQDDKIRVIVSDKNVGVTKAFWTENMYKQKKLPINQWIELSDLITKEPNK